MTTNAYVDWGTFGIALFWNAPMRSATLPTYLTKHSLTIIVGPLVIGVMW